MKYYCLGHAITAIKTKISHRFLDNLAVDKRPVSSNLPITQLQMRDAFLTSDDLILCKTIDAAMALRQNKCDFNPNGYPNSDYAIYEVEIDTPIEHLFCKLIDAPTIQLEHLVSSSLYYTASIFEDRSRIPNIEICLAKKKDIQPKLIACRYFSPLNGQEEFENKPDKPERCCIL